MVYLLMAQSTRHLDRSRNHRPHHHRLPNHHHHHHRPCYRGRDQTDWKGRSTPAFDLWLTHRSWLLRRNPIHQLVCLESLCLEIGSPLL